MTVRALITYFLH